MTRHGYGFGLGFGVLTDVTHSGMPGSLGEYGWGGAASTKCWLDPVENLIGILMLQYFPSSMVPIPIRDIYKTLVYQALIE